MTEATAYVETEFGAKYLVQMCKHFAHKIEVDYSDTHGECRFEGGIAVFDATADGLRMRVTAEKDETRAWAQSAIESHLLRFAFREQLESLDWR